MGRRGCLGDLCFTRRLPREQVAKQLSRTRTWVSNSEAGERRAEFFEHEDFAAFYGKPWDSFGTRGRR
jgi:hypothetical protein